MQRSFVLAAAAAATLITAGAAHAGGVNWSIGINVPPLAAVVGAPAYYPAPSYYAAPGYPAVTYDPPRAVYASPRVWLPPAPPLARVFWGGGYHDGWRREGWRNDDWRRDDHHDDGRRGGGHDEGGRRDDRGGRQR
jgi:hypothetical protein